MKKIKLESFQFEKLDEREMRDVLGGVSVATTSFSNSFTTSTKSGGGDSDSFDSDSDASRSIDEL
ncbi:TIGR04149 family rSAM-modified RiPP [Sphingobacterium sp. PCS056]|uniref:TIGR04149 family rSAM-modified RiPP n=1 Tax=Sphingobacterium sp. PCS056 TaxID=2931400 RepID=UPI00200CEFBE|nr:TIGR04149 family rSAM-modified RiPP [Sphingobacterium sp. PCS056]UPZ37490.1 TIGR04149 family rSAM-modified RiPP [Sphingobacterium sp. PCS056]